jgi:hypothetical protein
LNPFKSMFGGVATAKVHVSMVAIPTSLRGYASFGLPRTRLSPTPEAVPETPALDGSEMHFCVGRNETATPETHWRFRAFMPGNRRTTET